jgi:hypothetical protein
MVRAGGSRVPRGRVSAPGPSGTSVSWRRLVRLAVTGLLAGAAAGFVGALLRPRSWVEYAEPRVASRT